MRIVRKRFGASLNRLAGGSGVAVGGAAGAGADADVKRANRFWFVCLIVLVLLTVGVVIARGNSLGLQVIFASLWGLFVGGTILFFFHKHLVITLFGALVGGGLAESQSLADAVHHFAGVAAKLTAALNQAVSPSPHIYNGSVVVFLLLLALACLPAYGDG